jgi:hypothetical protein
MAVIGTATIKLVDCPRPEAVGPFIAVCSAKVNWSAGGRYDCAFMRDEVIRPQEFLEAFFNALDKDGHQGFREVSNGIGNAQVR